MGENSRVEDVTISLNNTTSNNSTIIGVDYPGQTAQSSKLRTAVVNVTSSGTNNKVYGIRSIGTTTNPLTPSSSQAVRASTVNVTLNGSGSTGCGIYLNNSNRFSSRDVNYYCRGNTGTNTTYGCLSDVNGGGVTGYLEVRNCTIGGDTYDTGRLGGVLSLAFTDLVHTMTDGNSFSITPEASNQSYTLTGNRTSTNQTYNLLPGSVDKSTANLLAGGIQLPFTANTIVLNSIFKATRALTGAETAVLDIHKNSTAIAPLATFTLNSTTQQIIITNKSINFLVTDSMLLQLTLSGFGNNDTTTFFLILGQY